jgi:hypothetical protein
VEYPRPLNRFKEDFYKNILVSSTTN